MLSTCCLFSLASSTPTSTHHGCSYVDLQLHVLTSLFTLFSGVTRRKYVMVFWREIVCIVHHVRQHTRRSSKQRSTHFAIDLGDNTKEHNTRCGSNFGVFFLFFLLLFSFYRRFVLLLLLGGCCCCCCFGGLLLWLLLFFSNNQCSLSQWI